MPEGADRDFIYAIFYPYNSLRETLAIRVRRCENIEAVFTLPLASWLVLGEGEYKSDIVLLCGGRHAIKVWSHRTDL